METETKIMSRLDEIKTELDFIKKHMIDIDSFLSQEDKLDIKQAEKELKEGKTKSLDTIKKELGL
ncbi:hypothetical protein ACFLZX_04895 [Nanoarchaeota archaeon]